MRTAFLLTVLAALPLGALASPQSASTTAVQLVQSADAQPHYLSNEVARLQLRHMSAEDLSTLIQFQYDFELWLRIEKRRNALLISGPAELVAHAKQLAAQLDVPVTAED